jgi:hypothetical protein
MSCELTCSQSSSLIAQNFREKVKFYKQKTTTGIGSGCEVTMIPHPGYGCIVILDFGAPPKVQQYLITIGTFLNALVSTSKIWQQSPWANVANGQVASIFILSLLS